MSTIAIAIVLLIVLAVCGVVVVLNWVSLVQAMRAGKGFAFAPPWLCGLVASVALWFYPHPAARSYFWLPLVLDPSLAPLALLMMCSVVQKIRAQP